MPREVINVGTSPDDNTGDPLRSAMTKVNNMTEELYDVAMDDPSGSLTDTSAAHFAERTDAPNPGVQLNLHAQYVADFLATQVGASVLADLINTGSNSGGNAHLPALIGRAEDTAVGAIPLWGCEGKVVSKGTIDGHYPFLAIHQRNKDTPLGAGSISLFAGFPEVTEADGTTPDNTGRVIHLDATLLGTGGDPTQRFAVYGGNGARISVDSLIESRNGVSSVGIYHDGDSSYIQDFAGPGGHVKIVPSIGAYVIVNGAGVAPASEGLPCGIDGFRFDGNFRNLNVSSNPPSSSSDTGTTGDITWDADYIYVCVATDTWKRIGISTW